MADKAQMESLLDLVRGAKGPDRDIDRQLHGEPIGTTRWGFIPEYTASIDASLALVERLLPGAWYVLAKGRLTAAEPLYGCELLFGTDEQLGIADGHSQPLAIIHALLSAIINKDSGNG